MVVLGCTHYPLLLQELTEAAPWPVTFIDPAPAIARRVRAVAAGLQVNGNRLAGLAGSVCFTDERAAGAAFVAMGFPLARIVPIPVA